MGEIKIDLLPEATPIKKISYKLAHKYKDIVKTKIDNMLTTKINTLLTKKDGKSPSLCNLKRMTQRN